MKNNIPNSAEKMTLRVEYEGRLIGALTVSEKHDRKIFGMLVPIDAKVVSAAFGEAMRWSYECDMSRDCGELDRAWRKYIPEILAITQKIRMPEVSEVIEEFAISHDFSVEITLQCDIPQAGES